MIPQDVVDGYLGALFGNSEPGQTIHQLMIAAAQPDGRGALGIPELGVTLYAIAPDGDVDTDQFIARVITTAVREAQQKQSVIHFAALVLEIHAVNDDGNEVTENLARRMQADRKLQDHPGAVETTLLYAACRDGRRWVGTHVLTGPRAGTVVGPELRLGALARDERGRHTWLVRTAVGIGTPLGEVIR